MIQLETVERVGLSAAFKGAAVLKSYFGKVKHIQKKGDIDLVTEADKTSEKVIIETIKNVFPDHSILAEESGLNEAQSKYQWIIDPLDGTTNYAHQLGLFGVSIAFAINHDIVFGIVLDPITEELFSARKGQGAMLNSKAIHVTQTKRVSDSLLVTGFPYDLRTMLEPLMKRFSNCLMAA